ncbi:MAG: type II secretion system protein [Verrucomicrobiota bacterium]
MKTPFKKRSQQGFTLVELLVVIVIIAILATLGAGVGISALQKARKVTAQSAATNVANAVEQFYSEYHVLPDPEDGATEDNAPYRSDTGEGITLLEILAAFEDEQNERKMQFLNLKEADNGKKRDGIVYNGTGDAVVGLYDPWGEPYYFVIDYDYDGRLEFTPSTAYTYNAKLNNKRVAVYSLGTDSPTDAKRKDLVKTW